MPTRMHAPSRRSKAGATLSSVALVALSGCAPPESSTLGRLAAPIVYGADDRIEPWQADGAQAALARQSAVALIESQHLRLSDPDDVGIRAAPLRAWDSYCEGTPFLDQPTAATCSGVLIDDDLLLTAGHCLERVASCGDYFYVFGYLYPEDGVLGRITRQEVFSCRRIAVLEVSPPDSEEQLDFAVVQLDRVVGPAQLPAPVSASARFPGEALTVIGFPSGLPAKLDAGAVVADARAAAFDRFTLTSDTFGASSGSGVYSAGSAELVAVFASGTADFVDQGGCRAIRRSSEAEGVGESAVHVSRAIDALCGAGWPSQRLCGLAPSCGDGICSGSVEDRGVCPVDCAAASCGDNVCDVEEWSSCPDDCGERRPAELPDDWYCEPSWYGDGGTCDCRCGAPDPDCGPTSRQRACDSYGPAGIEAGPAPPERDNGCALRGSSGGGASSVSLLLLLALRRRWLSGCRPVAGS
jgi:hypothetical protein